MRGLVLGVAATFLLASSSLAQDKKAATKAQVETLKPTNLTATTPAKEIKKLNKALKKIKGVKKVTVVKKKSELKVKFTAPATLDAIRAAIKAAGFTLPKLPDEEDALGDEGLDEPIGAGVDEEIE